MPDTHTPPFGRIRLDQVIDTWSSLSVLNPRFLASELAALLRTTGPDAQPLGSHAVAVTLFDSATGPGALTIGTLATYFERYSAGEQPSTVETTVGSARASAVYFDKSWIGRLEIETEARARTAAGLQQMHPAPRPTGGAQPSAQYQPPKSGSDPECLAVHQAQQRQEGEHSDAAQLDAERTARQLLEARLAIKETQIAQLIDECEQHRRAVSDEKRARLEAEAEQRAMEEQLEAAMAVAECLNPENPASPPELRMAFQCWRDITQDGTLNPSAAGGRGCHTLVSDWITSTRQQLNKDQAARLKAVVSWRKRGAGAIPTQ
jgi:hypothetical protein